MHQIHEVPLFRLHAYVVYPTDCDRAIFDVALETIRRTAAETLASSKPARSALE